MNINDKIHTCLHKLLYMSTEQIRDALAVRHGKKYSVEYVGRETRRAAALGLADFKWFDSFTYTDNKPIKTRYKMWKLPSIQQ
jgi:hypothetical protein